MISSSRTIARPSRLAALLLAAAVVVGWGARPAEAREWPDPLGHLSDFAGIVDPATADSIQALAAELKDRTGTELAVVTVKDLGGETIDPAAVELFEKWGIGGKERDDGVLILLALAERRVRIEVGYGLEGILPDGRTGSIIRLVMGPDLHADRFGSGLLRGAEAVSNVIAQDRGVTLERRGVGVAPSSERGGSPWLFFLIAILLPILISARMNWRRSGRWGDWRSGRRRNWYDPLGGFGGGLGGMGGFGGGGGGGGGGGFGGFGGGGSGGGGASGGF